MDNFKTRLENARKAKGYTQDELSKLLNKSRYTISNWEVGKTSPTTAVMQKLAETLDVSVEYLLNGTGTLPLAGEKDGKNANSSASSLTIPVLSHEATARLAGGIAPRDIIAARHTIVDRSKLNAYDAERPPFCVESVGNNLASVGLLDGFIVTVNPAEETPNGMLALLAVNGIACIRFLARRSNGIVLISCDAGTEKLTPEQQKDCDFSVIGTVVDWSPAKRPLKVF